MTLEKDESSGVGSRSRTASGVSKETYPPGISFAKILTVAEKWSGMINLFQIAKNIKQKIIHLQQPLNRQH